MLNSKKKKQINLIPKDGLDSSVFGRILKWALSSFRVMVIVTELVVMGAFLSRFWLDARNSDLNEAIDISKAQVSAYSSVEKEINLYQRRLSLTKSMYQEKRFSDILLELGRMMPEDISLNSITLSATTSQIKAVSKSEISLSQFLINLADYKKFINTKLSQVTANASDDNTTSFTVNADLKK